MPLPRGTMLQIRVRANANTHASVMCAPVKAPLCKGSIPPIRGKCPEGTKRVGMLSAKLTEGLRGRQSQICTHPRRPRRVCQISVGAGFYPARAECTIKIAQRTATAHNVL